MKKSFLIVLCLALSGCATLPRAPKGPSAPAFSLEDVARSAQESAAKPFDEGPKVPDFLTDLDYDAWRDIRYRADKAVWKDEGLPFQLQFFHTGLFYNRPVTIHLVEGSSVRTLPYSAELFDPGKNVFPGPVPSGMGLAGFRVHTQLNTRDYFDEAAVFLGASYFRAVSRGRQYGLSARGLAVDTAGSSGEEFPFFKEFWIVKPGRGDTSLTVFARMDSPSLAGAYRFIIHPGEVTRMEVDARVFLRKDVAKLGLAPATSMFFFGENVFASSVGVRDFRPEVHDSDGLQLHLNDDEWLWRPLVNLDRLFINSFQAEPLRGFGLLQRDTVFDHYQDLESRYEMRPSLWIVPHPSANDQGLWQKGRVELVQIPTQRETTDNIVTYWVPERKMAKGDELSFSYEMQWLDGAKALSPLASVTATRIGQVPDKKDLQVVLDLDGGALRRLAPEAEVKAEVRSDREDWRVSDVQAYRNQVTGGWRLAFQLAPQDKPGFELPGSQDPVVELRAALKSADQPLSETWSYAVQP